MENVIDRPMPSAGMAPSGRRRAVAALQVFAGGACYGAMATTYKLAYAAGFTWLQARRGSASCSSGSRCFSAVCAVCGGSVFPASRCSNSWGSVPSPARPRFCTATP